MASRQTEIADAVRTELERYPVAVEFGYGGKHPFARITTTDGRRRRVTYPATPGCRRATDNAVAGVRKLMAELKIEPRRTDG